jgi:ribonuclease HII
MMEQMQVGICGVDEAGRGPLAGPVYAAAVILGDRISRAGLADSKKLSSRMREQLRRRIEADAVAWSVASASVVEIDELNILQATLLAMQRAVQGLEVMPSAVLVDGLHCPRLSMTTRPVVRGDALIAEISAASILAKTVRDEHLIGLHARYPQYGFARHKGYGTVEHLAALRRFGPTPEHRRSFAPVRDALGQAR